jgi:oleate hydratase
MLDPSKSKVYLVGGGVASLAAAVFLIRDAGVPGGSIRVFEQRRAVGGGWPRSAEYDVCTANLLSTIPSPDDPTGSAWASEFARATDTEARIVRRDRFASAGPGCSARDRADLARLSALPEQAIGARRVDDYFRPEFFDSDFWCRWRAAFGFQPWHSAIELKRHLVCFGTHPRPGVRSRHGAVVAPMRQWLRECGVRLDFNVTVEDIGFRAESGGRRATTLYLTRSDGSPGRVTLGPQDGVFLTNGSTAADATHGDDHTVPDLIRTRRDGSWRLWESLARKESDFGKPSAFCGDIDRTGWRSFTLTMSDRTLPARVEALVGDGGPTTFPDSAWLLSVATPARPRPGVQRPGTHTLWGHGLRSDTPGDFVAKTMTACTGAEILDELLGHLGFDDIAAQTRRTTSVTTTQLPYASAPLQPRTLADRPLVVPEGAVNFAFLGQFVEIPEAVTFAVEYSVRSAMMAVYHHFAVDAPIPSPYRSIPADPRAAWFTPRKTGVPG